MKRLLAVVLAVLALGVAACAPEQPTPVPTAQPKVSQPTAVPVQPTSVLPQATIAPSQPTTAAPAPTAVPTKASAPALSGKLTLMIHPTLYDVTGGKGGMIDQFAKDNGIQIEVVTAQTNDIYAKVNVEGVAQSGRFDLYPIQDSWVNPDFVKYLEPLDSYLAGVDASYKPQDLIQTLVKAYKYPQGTGTQYGIPWRVGTAMLYYRKDLLDKAGVAVPKTMDEFYAAAKALTHKTSDGKTDVYGVAADLYPGGSQVLRIAYAYGATLLSPDWSSCTMNSAEGVAAVDMMSKIYQNGYVDKESLAWERDPVLAALQQGRAAMSITYSPYWSLLTDPKVGDAAKNMGWAVVPTAPGVPQGRTISDGWAWAIDKNSKNKQTAWAFIKMLTGPEQQLDLALNHANGPIRESVYQSSQYQAKIPPAQDWLKATAASAFRPAHLKYPQMLDIYNAETTSAVRGQKTPKQAMDDACSRINTLLK